MSLIERFVCVTAPRPDDVWLPDLIDVQLWSRPNGAAWHSEVTSATIPRRLAVKHALLECNLFYTYEGRFKCVVCDRDSADETLHVEPPMPASPITPLSVHGDGSRWDEI